ncbi:unnamed protein product [Rangifer tarandus platyrhynchus]|uniref:Uncharacterized protein n=2 Tax=Rangifer tarandus platyrhynchus TaxID=3082113 RepID=A0AC59ZWC9_RANTA|nr:unnamed protein product [Rangifer tarandus platyrhynchus]
MIYVLWFPHLINEEIETQRHSVSGPRSPSEDREGLGQSPVCLREAQAMLLLGSQAPSGCGVSRHCGGTFTILHPCLRKNLCASHNRDWRLQSREKSESFCFFFFPKPWDRRQQRKCLGIWLAPNLYPSDI